MSIMQLPPKKRSPNVTKKQIAVLRLLVKRNPDGSYLDVQELLAGVNSGEARGTMLSTIRHLHAHGLVEEDEMVLRRSRRVRTYRATQKGIDVIRPSAMNTGMV